MPPCSLTHRHCLDTFCVQVDKLKTLTLLEASELVRVYVLGCWLGLATRFSRRATALLSQLIVPQVRSWMQNWLCIRGSM
jgi:hypothetical protein